MLAPFLPLYAYLWIQGYINSPSALLMMSPFVFADAAGFVFNNITDIEDPYFKENPIVRGEIAWGQARIVLVVCLAISTLLFLLLYTTPVVFMIYFPYLFLCLAYSGLGLRFKETLLGPVVASFIVWVGGPLILTTEFMAFDGFTIGLLVGSLLVYIGRELHHMITDYENDLRSGYRTFAVQLGVQASSLLEAAAFVSGSVVLMISVLSFLGSWPRNWISFLLIAILSLATIIQVVCNLMGMATDSRSPYLLVRVFYVLCSAVILKVAPLIALFFLWIFLTSKRS